MKTVPALSIAVLLLAGLAGCADAPDPESKEATFDDVQFETPAHRGVILGVVIDEAIRPMQDVTVSLVGTGRSTVTDERGRFAFDDVAPGEQELNFSLHSYHTIVTRVMVEPGVDSPAPVKITLSRIFDQDPFSEQFSHRGFMECSRSGITYSGNPCITDYTVFVAAYIPAARDLPGCNNMGCAPQLNDVQNDDRYYNSPLGAGWQTQVFELTWEPTATATSQRLGMVVSHADRTAWHIFATVGSEDPLRLQLDKGEKHLSAREDETMPAIIPEEGLEGLIFYVGVRDNIIPFGLAIQQDFEVFHTKFYYGVPEKEDWSIVAGDELPF